MGRREAEHETQTTPADRPQDFPATGRRAVKPRPPLPAGVEAPWDGGKQSVKERETETTPASQKTPVMDVSRQARVVWVSTSTQNSKARAAWVSTSPQNSTTRAAQVSTSPQNSTTGAAQVSCEAVGAKQTGGADATAAPGRAVGRAPRHHPGNPSPGMPIALETHCPLAPSR